MQIWTKSLFYCHLFVPMAEKSKEGLQRANHCKTLSSFHASDFKKYIIKILKKKFKSSWWLIKLIRKQRKGHIYLRRSSQWEQPTVRPLAWGFNKHEWSFPPRIEQDVPGPLVAVSGNITGVSASVPASGPQAAPTKSSIDCPPGARGNMGAHCLPFLDWIIIPLWAWLSSPTGITSTAVLPPDIPHSPSGW